MGPLILRKRVPFAGRNAVGSRLTTEQRSIGLRGRQGLVQLPLRDSRVRVYANPASEAVAPQQASVPTPSSSNLVRTTLQAVQSVAPVQLVPGVTVGTAAQVAGGALTLLGVGTVIGRALNALAGKPPTSPDPLSASGQDQPAASTGVVSSSDAAAKVELLQAAVQATASDARQQLQQIEGAGGQGAGGQAAQQLSAALQAAQQLEGELSSVGRGLQMTKEDASTQGKLAKAALKESQRKVALLEAMVTALRERLHEEEARTTGLRAEVEAGKEELARVDGLRLELGARLELLKEELSTATRDLQEAQERTRVLKTRVAELEAYSARLEARVETLDKQVADQSSAAARAAADAERRISQVQAAADASARALSELQAGVSSREAELDQLKQQLEEERAAVLQVEQLMAAKEQQAAAGQQAAEQARAELANVSAAMRAATEEAMGMVKSREAQLEQLKGQLAAATAHAEKEAETRSQQLAQVKQTLEAAVSAARQEAAVSKQQLAQVQAEVEDLLKGDLRQLLFGGQGQVVMSGHQAAAARQLNGRGTPGGNGSGALLLDAVPADMRQALTELSAREGQLQAEIRARMEELALQTQVVLPRLPAEVAARANALDARVHELRRELAAAEARWEQDGSGAQAVSRLQREVSSASADLAGLYRSAMSPEMRARERALRAELQDRETELKGVVTEIARLKTAAGSRANNVSSNGTTPHNGSTGNSAVALRPGSLASSVRARLQELMVEREREMGARAAAFVQQREAAVREATIREVEREKERDAKAKLSEIEARYSAQLANAQAQLEAKVREAEATWRSQLSASQNAIAQAAHDKQRLAAEATLTAVQARQQLLELQGLREELSARSQQLAELKQAYESVKAGAAANAERAAAEAAVMAGQVHVLQEALNAREQEVTQLQDRQAALSSDLSPFADLAAPQVAVKQERNSTGPLPDLSLSALGFNFDVLGRSLSGADTTSSSASFDSTSTTSTTSTATSGRAPGDSLVDLAAAAQRQQSQSHQTTAFLQGGGATVSPNTAAGFSSSGNSSSSVGGGNSSGGMGGGSAGDGPMSTLRGLSPSLDQAVSAGVIGTGVSAQAYLRTGSASPAPPTTQSGSTTKSGTSTAGGSSTSGGTSNTGSDSSSPQRPGASGGKPAAAAAAVAAAAAAAAAAKPSGNSGSVSQSTPGTSAPTTFNNPASSSSGSNTVVPTNSASTTTTEPRGVNIVGAPTTSTSPPSQPTSSPATTTPPSSSLPPYPPPTPMPGRSSVPSTPNLSRPPPVSPPAPGTANPASTQGRTNPAAPPAPAGGWGAAAAAAAAAQAARRAPAGGPPPTPIPGRGPGMNPNSPGGTSTSSSTTTGQPGTTTPGQQGQQQQQVPNLGLPQGPKRFGSGTTPAPARGQVNYAAGSEWGKPKGGATSSTPTAGSNTFKPGSGATPTNAAAGGAAYTQQQQQQQGGASGSSSAGGQSSPSPFPEIEDLGAEVARITQSLISRTVTPKSSRPSNTAGSNAAGSGSATAQKPGAGSAGYQSPQQQQQQVASPSTSSSTSGVSTAPQNTPVAGGLRLVAGSFILPHEAKVARGGEDAVMVSNAGGGALAVADGVGGWAADGIDAAAYARAFCAAANQAVDATGGAEGAREVLEYAQSAVDVPGSCTICLALMRSEKRVLEVANVGDSGLRVIRGGKIVMATAVQEHQYNMPYQLACPAVLKETDTAADAQLYSIPVQEGDVIILATDGLFDNLWEEQIAQTAAQLCGPGQQATPGRAAALAQKLATMAHQVARDPNARSPWAVEAATAAPNTPLLQRLFPRGGKMDDVSVVVGIVAK